MVQKQGVGDVPETVRAELFAKLNRTSTGDVGLDHCPTHGLETIILPVQFADSSDLRRERLHDLDRISTEERFIARLIGIQHPPVYDLLPVTSSMWRI
jgi:hypothetical protein